MDHKLRLSEKHQKTGSRLPVFDDGSMDVVGVCDLCTVCTWYALVTYLVIISMMREIATVTTPLIIRMQRTQAMIRIQRFCFLFAMISVSPVTQF